MKYFLNRIGTARHGPSYTYLAAWVLFVNGFAAPPAWPQESIVNATDHAALRVVLNLASDFSAADARQQHEMLDRIHREGEAFDAERFLVHAFFDVDADSNFVGLVDAEGARLSDHLLALHRSYARYKGARAAAHPAWAMKHIKATQQYAAVVAEALEANAKRNNENVLQLEAEGFAIRRSSEQQTAFVAKLAAEGLPSRHRELLLASGRTEDEIKSYIDELLAAPREQIGVSVVELLQEMADSRRHLAGQLLAFSAADPMVLTGIGLQEFLVGNPTDREATVDLYLRPVSISPLWKLSVMDATEPDSEDENAQPLVQEVKEGEHYRVRLPAGGETRVASLLMPVGPVGPNTTARWAVEGKIGGELIGGMMHEMHVPAVAADPELPPVAIAPVAVDTTAPSGRLAMLLIVGTLMVSVLLAVILVLRIRKTKGGAS